jgi:hypothetical protein
MIFSEDRCTLFRIMRYAGLVSFTGIRSCSIAIDASAVAVCFSTPSLTEKTSAATTAT